MSRLFASFHVYRIDDIFRSLVCEVEVVPRVEKDTTTVRHHGHENAVVVEDQVTTATTTTNGQFLQCPKFECSNLPQSSDTNVQLVISLAFIHVVFLQECQISCSIMKQSNGNHVDSYTFTILTRRVIRERVQRSNDPEERRQDACCTGHRREAAWPVPSL